MKIKMKIRMRHYLGLGIGMEEEHIEKKKNLAIKKMNLFFHINKQI